MDKTESIGIAAALKKSPPKESELAELVRLYSTPGGFPYMMDARGRPQGETIGQCRLVGSRLNRLMGSAYRYGMNVVGHCHQPSATWRMRPEFRVAMELSKLVTPAGNHTQDLGEMNAGEEMALAIEARIAQDPGLSETEKQQLIRARVGQGVFRTSVHRLEGSCRVTGVAQMELLQACHVKPWAQASNAERLDGANGLLLSPSMHSLFDNGYITFDEAGRLHKSTTLPVEIEQAWNVHQTAKPRAFLPEQVRFLRYHQAKVFVT